MPLPKEAEGKPEFEFEIEGEDQGKPVENEVAAKGKPEVDIEIEDDTPEEDRGRTPLPQEIVQELEADELEEYSDKVKTRLKQMKKVWHDERRVISDLIIPLSYCSSMLGIPHKMRYPEGSGNCLALRSSVSGRVLTSPSSVAMASSVIVFFHPFFCFNKNIVCDQKSAINTTGILICPKIFGFT